MTALTIRSEHPGDASVVEAIARAAFRDHPHSRHDEPLIIRTLRRSNALSLSLVAQVGTAVVGHVAFSPVKMEGGAPGWYGAGPLAVAPSWQRQGIGQRLMGQGLDRLRRMGAQGCVVVGDPAYYARFGFAAMAGVETAGVPASLLLCLPWRSPPPVGLVRFHPAFNEPEA